MKVSFIRNTGAFGKGTPLEIYQNGIKVAVLESDQAITLEMEISSTFQVKSGWLESAPFLVRKRLGHAFYEVAVNPTIVLNYGVSLLVFPFLGLLSQPWFVDCFILLPVGIFLLKTSKQGYLIKELSGDGSKS